MRLFIDECLSPDYALWLNETGEHDAVHPLHVGRRGEPDHRVLSRCIEEDRILVTQNGVDFRALASRSEVHPGLVLLPAGAKAATWALLLEALEAIEFQGDARRVMTNRVVEVSGPGQITFHDLP